MANPLNTGSQKNRIRGVRQSLPANVFLGRGSGKGGPAQALSAVNVATALINTGQVVPAGGASSLAAVADGDILANITGSTAAPSGNTLTAVIDHVFGSAEGDILQRGASAWQVLTPGTSGQVLTSGGASALNSWTTISSGGSFTAFGAWSASTGYLPFDVVTYMGSAYCCYVAVSATGLPTAAQWTSFTGMTISTTATTNDTAASNGTANANAIGNGNSNPGITAGKAYCEFAMSGLNDAGTGIGITTASGILVSGVNCTHDGRIVSTFSGGGSDGVGTFNGILSGHTAGLCVDFGAALFWVCTDVTDIGVNSNGYWNGSATANPATGTGGVALGTVPGACFPCFYAQSQPNQEAQLFTLTASFAISAVPSGFSDIFSKPGTGSNPPPTTDDTHWFSQGSGGSSFITSVSNDFSVVGAELKLQPRVKPIRNPLDYTPGDELPLASLAMSSLDTNVFKHALLGGL